MDNVVVMPGRQVLNFGRPEPAALSWEELERRDWHLWILAILLMFVLGISLLSFMFPTAYWFREEMALAAPQRAFLGFSILLALVLVYLLQRQATMRRLKRQLFQAHAAADDARRQSNLQSFLSLPGINQFRDGLAMEYRRASTSGSRLAVVLFSVRGSSHEDMGHVATFLRHMLRRNETIGRISDTTLGIMLPEMQLSEATSFATQVEERLAIQRPALTLISTVTAYPQESACLSDLESPLRSMLN